MQGAGVSKGHAARRQTVPIRFQSAHSVDGNSGALHMAIPPGWEGQVRPRSGLAYKKGLTVLNSPGTIDADYRGEVKVILINLGREKVVIEPGERIAQLIIAEVISADFRKMEELPPTDRGGGGFGSTGT